MSVKPKNASSKPKKARSKTSAEPLPEISLNVTPLPSKPGRFIAVATNGVGNLNRDTLDLNSASARNRFITSTVAALKEQASDKKSIDKVLVAVRKNLDDQLLAFAAVPPGNREPPPSTTPPTEDPRIEALAKMPQDIRNDAGDLLADPNLLARVSADIEALGVAGERNNAQTLYLVGTSAQLHRPLNAIVRGESSSGKSFVLDTVSYLFPPEVVLRATSLTTNSLFYFPPGALRHRWVVAGERSRRNDEDATDGTRALREMTESGRLSKLVTLKIGDRFVTELIEQDGPIAYSETTTQLNIFAEDANRCLLLNTDETEKQTGCILDQTAVTATGETRHDVERIIALHHAIQRMIPRVDVIIPFAKAIVPHFPKERTECRRDFRHLLQLVKAVALLHFQQRVRDANGSIIATLDDYEIAERLARGPLGTAACGTPEGALTLLGQLRDTFGRNEFTTTEAKSAVGLLVPERTLTMRLNILSRADAVKQNARAKGCLPARWKLTGVTPEAGAGVLPSVEQVREAFQQCRHADKH